jgi:hypothetical protein
LQEKINYPLFKNPEKMKKLIHLFLFILLSSYGILAQEVTAKHLISFKACNVEKSKELLKTKPYREVVISKTVIQPNEKDKSNAIFSDTTLKF